MSATHGFVKLDFHTPEVQEARRVVRAGPGKQDTGPERNFVNRPLKFLVLGLLGLVALVVVGASLVPILFRDQVVERLQRELNQQLDATVSFAEIDVSLLSTFPTLTAEVTELSIV